MISSYKIENSKLHTIFLNSSHLILNKYMYNLGSKTILYSLSSLFFLLFTKTYKSFKTKKKVLRIIKQAGSANKISI